MEGGRRLAIYGLGGCGKTAIALVTAYRIKERQPARAIFWVPAFNPESFEKAYRDIGTHSGIPGITDSRADVKMLVKERLNDPNFGPWLMIVDNADDTSVFVDPLQEQSGVNRLIDWLPLSCKGSFIFTTRSRKIAIDLAGTNVMRLGELDESEAREMLQRQLLQNDLLEGDDVYDFLKILAYLPLAIVQAVAFVNGNNIRLSQYTDLYRTSEKDATDLLNSEFEDQGRYWNTKNPVATTWHISFKYIQTKDPRASEYLSFMACTTGENIPASLLPHETAGRAHIEAIGTLDAYAFISIRQQRQRTQQMRRQEEAFDIHRLVRLVTRAWLEQHNQWNLWAEKALSRLVEVVPFGDREKREIWTAYLPHGIHVVNLPETYNREDRILLLDRIGHCERELGDFKVMEWAFEQVLKERENSMGREHLETLTSKERLAMALSELGRHADAERMHRETLAISDKAFGKEFPFTLLLMDILGSAMGGQGKHIEAEQIHRETLALREKVLGTEHRDTLISASALGDALEGQAKYVEAEQIHQETLARREKVLGKEHRDTLSSMRHLGDTLRYQGKYTEAEETFQRALDGYEKMLGREDTWTLDIVENLGHLYRSQGKLVEAEEMYQRVLDGYERTVGREHKWTLRAVEDFGHLYQRQGKLVEAEEMYQRATTGYEKAVGREHRATLRIVEHLGHLYRSQGKLVEAEKMYQRALDGREKTVGPEHRWTLRIVENLGHLYRSQGKLVDAEEMYQRALDGYRKLLGYEHISTPGISNNLRRLKACQSELKRVEEEQSQALDGGDEAHDASLASAAASIDLL